jgi:hypothetical protein
VKRGVRARVTGGQGGIEPNGPAVSADELAFSTIGGPRRGWDAFLGLGGQRGRAAERGVQCRELAGSKGDPVDIERAGSEPAGAVGVLPKPAGL